MAFYRYLSTHTFLYTHLYTHLLHTPFYTRISTHTFLYTPFYTHFLHPLFYTPLSTHTFLCTHFYTHLSTHTFLHTPFTHTFPLLPYLLLISQCRDARIAASPALGSRPVRPDPEEQRCVQRGAGPALLPCSQPRTLTCPPRALLPQPRHRSQGSRWPQRCACACTCHTVINGGDCI